MFVLLGFFLVLALFFGTLMLTNNPRKTLDQFIQKVEAKDTEKIIALVPSELKPKQKNKILNFLRPWIKAESLQIIVKKEEAWREEKIKEKNRQEKMLRFKPTPRYWAHYYHAEIVATFDGIEETATIELERKTKNTWNAFSQIFKPWKVVSVHYPSAKKNSSFYEDISSEVEVIQDSSENSNKNINTENISDQNANIQ